MITIEHVYMERALYQMTIIKLLAEKYISFSDMNFAEHLPMP